MDHPPFIQPRSIMREIWGDPNVVLLIFAGAAAEFALNRAVDWLFFTNQLPRDPIGRLFSTVKYAQRIVFADQAQAEKALASISRIHMEVERRRGERIPEWAYRDVLYLLIFYSERAYRLLHRPLTPAEREELYAGFLMLGRGLGVQALPASFRAWRLDREHHLQNDLAYSEYTRHLYAQYRTHLGAVRYRMLLELQAILAPPRVRELLQLRPKRLLIAPSLQLYSLLVQSGFESQLQRALVPQKHWNELAGLRPAAS